MLGTSFTVPSPEAMALAMAPMSVVDAAFGDGLVGEGSTANHAAAVAEHGLNRALVGFAPRDVVLGLLKHATVLIVLGDDHRVVHAGEVEVVHGLADGPLDLHVASNSNNNPTHQIALP